MFFEIKISCILYILLSQLYYLFDATNLGQHSVWLNYSFVCLFLLKMPDEMKK